VRSLRTAGVNSRERLSEVALLDYAPLLLRSILRSNNETNKAFFVMMKKA
jgi:hypothetical protein